ncbi:MAG: hypothetical protein NVV62_13205 [Terricaulis sp.]|nr:hypothetical protein [Terricaulis sp.]
MSALGAAQTKARGAALTQQAHPPPAEAASNCASISAVHAAAQNGQVGVIDDGMSELLFNSKSALVERKLSIELKN